MRTTTDDEKGRWEDDGGGRLADANWWRIARSTEGWWHKASNAREEQSPSPNPNTKGEQCPTTG